MRPFDSPCIERVYRNKVLHAGHGAVLPLKVAAWRHVPWAAYRAVASGFGIRQ
jgi:hypothetical protein